MSLPIHETFHSFQGEGDHAGRRAFFIRTYGCPVHCPWCDSAGTWHPDWKPAGGVVRRGIPDLVSEAVESGADRIIITGGEPCVHQETAYLACALRYAGFQVHLETCGAYPFVRSSFDWITISPKRNKPPLSSQVLLADEIKIIVDREGEVEYWDELLRLKEFRGSIWLHPEWGCSGNKTMLDYITRMVSSDSRFRAGWQLHKLYAADSLDPRSAPIVPLGGVSNKQ